MTETFIQDVLIDGNQDTEQLRVQGNTQQTEPLQTWEDSAGSVLAQVTGDGRLQVGDNLGMATPDALLEAHRAEASTAKPARGIHSLGQIGGTLNNLVQWMAGELEVHGSEAINALHTTLRIRASNLNTGTPTANAELRAADIEVFNDASAGAATLPKATGLQVAVTNAAGKTIEEAVGLRVKMTNDGTITNPYSIYVEGEGPAHFEDYLEVEPSVPAAPFTLGANAQGQLVTGLNADKLDGQDATAFAAAVHPHLISDVTSLQAELDGKAPTLHTHDDRYYTEVEVDTALASKANTSHTHDDRYYTESEVDTALAEKSNVGHIHPISDVTDLQAVLDGKAAVNHTHNVFTGATLVDPGTAGFVPAPAAGDAASKFLKADGTWAVPSTGSAAPSYVRRDGFSHRNSNSVYVGIGMANMSTVGHALATVTDEDGMWLRVTLANGTGTQALYTPTYNLVAFQNCPTWELRFKSPTTLINRRWWLGFTSSQFTNSPTAPGHCAAVRYDTTAGDTGFVAVTRNGTNQSVSGNINGALVADTLYRLRIRCDYANSRIDFSLNDVEISLTTTLPGASQLLGISLYGCITATGSPPSWKVGPSDCYWNY